MINKLKAFQKYNLKHRTTYINNYSISTPKGG